MLKEDAKSQGTKNGVAVLMHLTLGARVGNLEPLHTYIRMLPRHEGVCIANACVKGMPSLAPLAFLNRTIPSLFPTRLQSSAK